MGFFDRIKTSIDYTRCSLKISKCFREQGIPDKGEGKIIIDFITDYEFWRKKCIEVLHPLTVKESISLFSIIYYLLKIQIDGDDYYWSEDKTEMNREESDYWIRVSDLLETPTEIYRDFILDNEFKDYKGDVNFEFDKHLNHLVNLNFSNFITSENFKHLISKYLFIFLKSDNFDKVDIMKNIIMKDEKSGIINIEEVENQIEEILFTSTDIGFDFDKQQFLLVELNSFVDLSLRKCFDNNEIFSMSKRFSHLYN